MATASSHLLQVLSIRRVHNALPTSSETHAYKPASIPCTAALPGRRQWLFLLTATTTLKALELPSRAEDIPLFGLRKKLKKVEEEAEEIIKEGIVAAEKGIITAERGIETAEKEIETTEKEIETAELDEFGVEGIPHLLSWIEMAVRRQCRTKTSKTVPA
ncbi:hypothetical protein F0562_006508 [Nyssa sinensis]|uniref:Uncharacterized protein n=1 Tax=Nyssa sinensis TaxID=561372 RepID=A0A5J5AL36_9ASTE|nr:hypothetical protein F0562_006508 [Nyssa sinensis]